MKFHELKLIDELLSAVSKKGYKVPTPIQAQSIPAILNGKDLLGGAQTGTGKTAAFALPILQLLKNSARPGKNPRALVLTPTRELAAQVGESFQTYGKSLPLKTSIIFGGIKINPQISDLRKGTDILVATPGRLLDHLNQNTLNLKDIDILVLDEADRMLDMGFIRDIRKIIRYLPELRQNLLFSATYSDEIRKLSSDILNDPAVVEVARRNEAADKVEQLCYSAEKKQKRHLLAHLINRHSWYRVLVFVRTKHGANRLCKQLVKAGISSGAIHGDKSQNARLRVLGEFKKGDLQVLVATDVAARGIHLEELGHVVNFDLPQVAEDYIHRIGRTGRAGKSGQAISFLSPDEKDQWNKIQKILKKPVAVSKPEGFVPVVMEPSQYRDSRSENSSGRNQRRSGQGSGNRQGKTQQNRRKSHSDNKTASYTKDKGTSRGNKSGVGGRSTERKSPSQGHRSRPVHRNDRSAIRNMVTEAVRG